MTSQIVRVLCFPLFLFFSADGFIASHDVNRNRQTTLCMGGYYAEPDAPQSTATGKGTGTRSRQQHMIFGIPCIEETFVFHSSLKITNLLPDNQQSDHDNEQHDCLQMSTTQHLLRYLQANINFKDKSVVEVGASAVSIAAAVAFEAAAVTLYHPDAELLRIWEHSLRYFNAPSSCTITTSKWVSFASRNVRTGPRYGIQRSKYCIFHHSFTCLYFGLQKHSILSFIHSNSTAYSHLLIYY